MSKEPREFYIEPQIFNDAVQSSPFENSIHVIEYSAITALKAEIDQLQQYNDAAILAKQNAALLTELRQARNVLDSIASPIAFDMCGDVLTVFDRDFLVKKAHKEADRLDEFLKGFDND